MFVLFNICYEKYHFQIIMYTFFYDTDPIDLEDIDDSCDEDKEFDEYECIIVTEGNLYIFLY